MIDEHRAIFEEARDSARDAHDKIRQFKDAAPGSLGPSPDSLLAMQQERLLLSYTQLLSLQFRYSDASEVQNAVTNAEAYMADCQLPYEDRAERHRRDLREQYATIRNTFQTAREAFLRVREDYIGRLASGAPHGLDCNHYNSLLDTVESAASAGLRQYPNDATFKSGLDQVAALRALNEF